MLLESERLFIKEFTLDMAKDVHINSLDEDNRKFVPDEVFETEQDAFETLQYLISVYEFKEGPFVYPIFLKDNTNIGYVQLIPLNELEYEIGYHIAKLYTGKGYATEAIKVFLDCIKKDNRLSYVIGVCLKENIASCKVMEKVGFIKTYEGISYYQGQKRIVCRYKYKF